MSLCDNWQMEQTMRISTRKSTKLRKMNVCVKLLEIEISEHEVTN